MREESRVQQKSQIIMYA